MNNMEKQPDYAAQISRRIKQLRMSNGMSLRELARRSGLPPESVSRSERGVTAITITNLHKICRGLNIDLPAFFSLSGNNPRKEENPPALNRIIGLLSRLSPDSLRNVSKALELLLGSSVHSK